ncbi:MAG: S41 family peptidase [Gemmatimonadota bacterium]|jgi:tricorn protease
MRTPAIPKWSAFTLAASLLLGPGLAAQTTPGATRASAPVLIDHTEPADVGSVEDGLGFYRDPALHGQTLVFQAEGDLWSVPLAGGTARRLTTHPGLESHPTISPDGTTLAFTAVYEGPNELYTMPLAGGPTVRQTYEGERSEATTWTPDGRLVYTTSRYATLPRLQLVMLDPGSGARTPIPLYEATEGAFDDTGRTLFFVRPADHGNVTKRYEGGTARDVWRFDLDAGEEAVELTGDWIGESHSPMWWDGRVYFVSDRDGTMNLWSMAEDGTDVRQHTRHSGMDIRDPTLSDGTIVYNVGADLWRWDVGSAAPRRIPITLASDFDQLREKWETEPMEHLTSVHLHPEGEAVVLTARGRVFVAPAGSGRLARLSRDDGVRYRDATFTADGEGVLALSDATGELEFVTLPVDGVGEPEPLTDDGAILRFEGVPSPDGEWIAYTDNNADLWVMRADGSDGRVITEDRDGAGDLAWSPDGRWLAYRKQAPNSFQRIQLYDTRAGETLRVTSDRVNSTSPAWSHDGEHLYFLSDRNLRSAVSSPWGARAPTPYFPEPMELYAVALREGGDTPFRPRDELMPEEDEKAEDGGDRGAASREARDRAGGPEEAAAEPPAVVIDAAGLAERVWRVPVPAGDHRQLTAGRTVLFWTDAAEEGPGRNLMAIEVGRDEPEPVQVAEGVSGYELSADGRKLLVRRRNDLFVVDARAARADLSDAAVGLDGWSFALDPREDWRQIFIDAWRLERDYFYDPDMHGVDWEAVRDRYLPLVARVTTRDELSDVIGQVVGELSALHTSVRGGDLRDGPEDVDVASLGARLARDAAAGGYRIEKIYRHDPDYPDERSPLADPALGIDEGDVIVAVNGRNALDVRDPGALLRGQAGRQVLLSVRPAAGGEPFEAVAVPMAGERDLRYTDWEVTRRERVEEAGGGRLGYVHLRAMGGGNITEWYRQFFPVFDRGGLIVDVRTNRGGNIDSFILNDLIREAWMYWKSRVGRNTWNMQYAFRGHLVVLVDQSTASDGEAFADGFRRLGLGPVIGTRTWGGEIWLSSVNRLSDGGLARAPMMGVYGPESEWLIEQVGVVPDVVVDNLPHATFEGRDAQLETAIEYLLDRLDEDPRGVPVAPPYPDRSFDYPVVRTDGSGGGGR